MSLPKSAAGPLKAVDMPRRISGGKFDSTARIVHVPMKRAAAKWDARLANSMDKEESRLETGC